MVPTSADRSRRGADRPDVRSRRLLWAGELTFMHLISAPRNRLASLTTIRPHVASARKLTRCSFKVCRVRDRLGLCRPKRRACCWCKVATVPESRTSHWLRKKNRAPPRRWSRGWTLSSARSERRRCKSTRKRRTGLTKTPRRRLAATSKYEIARWLHNCAWRPRATISAGRSSVPYGRGRRSNYPCCESKPRWLRLSSDRHPKVVYAHSPSPSASRPEHAPLLAHIPGSLD